MGSGEASSDPTTYYEPGDVEAYVARAANTIKALQVRLKEAQRRAEEAEHTARESAMREQAVRQKAARGDAVCGDAVCGDAVRGSAERGSAAREGAESAEMRRDHPAEPARLGRALLLASEVAEKTLADADGAAAVILRGAEEKAAAIVAAGRAEADRLVEVAIASADDAFRTGQFRLLSAVDAFVEGSNLLRNQLKRIADDARTPPEPVRPSRAKEGTNLLDAPIMVTPY